MFFKTKRHHDPVLNGGIGPSLKRLQLAGLLVAAVADPHGVVPAAGRHGPSLLGAVVAHSLATGAAVVDGEARRELSLALVAGADVLVGDPVGRACRVLHDSCGGPLENAFDMMDRK